VEGYPQSNRQKRRNHIPGVVANNLRHTIIPFISIKRSFTASLLEPSRFFKVSCCNTQLLLIVTFKDILEAMHVFQQETVRLFRFQNA
jgi:hypothetical protein